MDAATSPASGRAAVRGEVEHGVRLRLTRRGRAAVGVLAALVALLTGFLGGRADAASAAQASASVESASVEVVVLRGDTLWSIASDVAAPGEDLREVVAEIQRLNGMSSASIAAGDVVRVPVR